MAESVKSMMRQGLISGRAHRIGNLGVWAHGPRGTTAHKSKMAEFNDQSKTDDYYPQGGVVKRGAIDQNQKFGPKISKGGRAPGGSPPKVDEINQSPMQTPKFPPGGKAKARKFRQPGTGARQRPSGPRYGGPSGRP